MLQLYTEPTHSCCVLRAARSHMLPAARLKAALLAAWACGPAVRGGGVQVEDASQKIRIAYVVNTWWPKSDGAAISAMGHVRHFVDAGHAVLVVRPAFDQLIMRSAEAAGETVDPLPATERLSFVGYGTVPGARGGGYEIVLDPLQFYDAEVALADWRPDVLLMMDPDMFMFDAFRLPGFNSLVLPRADGRAQPSDSPVTIACFTTFLVDGVFKLPDFWWVPQWARPLLDAGMTTAYGHFDHIFVNGESTLLYLGKQTAQVRSPGTPFNLGGRAQLVKSRGVSDSFCHGPGGDESCDAVRAGLMLRKRPAGTLAVVYVGRLAYDKAVDELLAVHIKALQQLGWPAVCLYVVGVGELEPTVRQVATKYPRHVVHVGAVAHRHVSCVLREADVYISAAPNETYGRAMVEALRCSLPVVALASCNLHVTHDVNGLLADDSDALVEMLSKAISEPALRARLSRGTRTHSPSAVAAATDNPNERMLQASIQAHAATVGSPDGVRRPARTHPYHWMWSRLLAISLVLDAPPSTLTLILMVGTTVLAMGACVWASCCRPLARMAQITEPPHARAGKQD